MSIETKARNKRFVQLAVTTALATTALTACTGKAAPSHSYSAAHAEQALSKGRTSKAVQHAEAAVLASPRDAYSRTLLGNAYLEDGRFASAATTFAEAVELGDTAPRTIISYTLAQIAIGDQVGALAEDYAGSNPRVGDRCVKVAVTAAACDDPSDGFAACHRYQQDWGIPVEVSPGASTGLDLDLRSV